MTLEEFQRRLIAQKNAQSQSLLNPNLKLDNYTNDTKKNNYDNNLENKVISNNPNTKEVLKAPISQSVNEKLNIDPSTIKHNNTIFDDIGTNIKNFNIGVKQGGLNFVNTFAKIGNTISDKLFNRTEKTEKSIDEDLKMYGIDGTGLTLQEKVNKLIETDPLSMDKYSRVLQSNGIEYRGNDILSNIGNAVSMLQANTGNIFTAPYDEIINGVSLTEDDEGNVISDSPVSKRDVNAIDNKIKDLEEEANKNTEQVDNSLLKYTAGLMPSIGNNASSLVSNVVAPGSGSIYFTASATNSYALDGKEKGLSDDASLLYGATLGYLDGQLEKIGLNNLTKAGKDMVKGATKEAIKSYATSMLDNYIQEALMEPAQETVNQIFTGESDWKGMPSRMNQAGIAGAVSSAILGGVSAGVSKGVNIATNTNQQNKLKTQITEKINNNTMLEKDVKTQMLNSLDKLNVNSLTNLNHELDTIDEVITQINKSDITNVIESRRNSLNNNQNSKAYLFSQYKNSKLDNNVINSAMEIVPSNKQNKRTKEQWLKVAEQIGNNINSEDAEMYAYKTWMDMRPNNKNNLNRQGKSYVSFTVDEWVNKVKEASNNTVNNQEQKLNIEMEEIASKKRQQYEIIQKTNPMLDDYHTGIRSLEDIKTFNEAINDDESFTWGDFSKEDAQQALKQGKVTVYSSHPIEQGAFVSTSKIQAQEYAGGDESKVYSKEVPLDDVAWINGDEGQYAKLPNSKTDKLVDLNNQKISEKEKNNSNINIDNKISEETQLKNDIDNFSKQVDSVINGTFPKNDMLTLLSNTPKSLQDIGLSNLPITMTQRHLDTIMNSKGKYKNANYHNLGEKIVKQLPEAISNPLDILQSKTDKNSIVLTTYLADKNNNTVVASIKIDGKGQINNIEIDTNVMTSAYGKDNYDNFMRKNIKQGNLLYDIDRGVIKKATMARFQLPRHSSYVDVVDNTSTINNIIPSEQNYVNNAENNQKIAPVKKIMNPAEIAKLTLEDANITPNLKNKDYTKGNKQSSFYKNITQTSKFLNEDYRESMAKDENIKYYKGISNKEQLKNAYDRLNKDGQSETNKWFAKETKEMTADDVAEGWILLKLYQDKGDIKSAIQVAKKMRDAGTKAGQQIQAYNILQRLTPEGMFYYVQSELDEAYNKMVKGKSKAWIEENRSKFELTPQETEFIKENMNDLQNITDEYERKVKLAEIQKLFTDKIPPARGQGIKSWMRISMLFNPKTQVRNIAGNAVIIPVNMFSDSVSAGIDKLIFKKTGVRTTGMTNLKSYSKGFIKGLYESYNDFIKGINTRNIQGDRFEIGKGGKSFKNEGIGKTLNRVDSLLSFVLDAGDRGFYEASFINSINNQLVLNNTTEVTQDMVDIATTEALQRTWQDNNEYTKTVLGIRNKINKFNIAGYGVGDVLIPFAKTPANLTKAIIDYSPVGVISTIKSGVKLKNAIETGQFTPQMQHDFVQKLGKATAGTMLYILGYALASAGIATGESDEDKDVANFMKNTLGTSSYSIKIGDKTFTYDWAQPVATPFAIMTNFVKYNTENPDASIIDKAINSLNIGTNQLLEQSFMESINTVLNGNGNIIENLSEAVLDLPSRAVPTFMKQIADMVDPIQRTTYDKTSPTNTAINKVKAKIPFVSKNLAPTVDTLGREVKKYGGNNGIFNVFINPANVNSSSISKSAQEIFKLYKATGDKTIMPRVAGYSLTYNNENYNLTPEERATYQKTMGKYVDKTVEKLLNNSNYKSLTNTEKTEIINQIVSDGNEYAKEEYAKNNNIEYERKNMNVKVDNKIKEGLDTTNAYIFKTKINDIEGEKGVTNSELNNKLKYIMNMDTDDKQKQFMVELSSNDTDYNVSVNDLNKLKGNYLTYLQQSGKTPENGGMTAREKYIKLVDANIPVEQLNKYYNEIGDVEGTKDENGKTISGSKKQAVFNYINSLSLNIPQKQILLAKEYDSFAKEYYWDIVNYINSLNITKEEKSSIFSSIYN